MSIFKALAPKEDEFELVTRYAHLMEYAEVLQLGPEQIEQCVIKADLNNGIYTGIKLEDLKIYMESLVARGAINTALHTDTKFEIQNDDSLDWYLEQQLEYKSKLEAYEVQYAELKRAAQSKLDTLEYLFGKQVDDYAISEFQRTGKKTKVLPHGTVAIGETKPSLKIGSESDLQAWLEKLEPESKAKFEVYPKTFTRNLDALKAEVEKGSAIPGIVKDEGGLKVSVKAPKEAV